MDDFPGETRDAGEGKAFGNPAALLPPHLIGARNLLLQIPRVLDVVFKARDIKGARGWLQFQARDRLVR